MTPEKKADPGPKTATSTPVSSNRKTWMPKSPVEVILDQIGKQEKKVSELQRQLDIEKSMLTKLLQAKKVLEAT
jgi:hypothetical protein